MVVNPLVLASPRGYSHGLLFTGAQKLLFVAGQIGWDGEGKLVGAEFVSQFRRALENVLAVVQQAGGTPDCIGRLVIYVTDKQLYLAHTRPVGVIYRELMGAHYPAMALVQVAGLLEDGALVEIEATAVL
jgi:enamine deaminase RidA (YjgF/YER057c/UK114 family)